MLQRFFNFGDPEAIDGQNESRRLRHSFLKGISVVTFRLELMVEKTRDFRTAWLYRMSYTHLLA
jgi:hypothetical protein